MTSKTSSRERLARIKVEDILRALDEKKISSTCNLCDSDTLRLVSSDDAVFLQEEQVFTYTEEGKQRKSGWSYIMLCQNCGNQNYLNALFIEQHITKAE